MIKPLLTGAAMTVAATVATAAHAASGWYVSGDVGGYFRESERENWGIATWPPVTCPPGPSTCGFFPTYVGGVLTPHYTPGIVGHLAVGRRLFGKLRVEAEVGIARYTTDKATVSGAGAGVDGTYAGGSLWDYPGMGKVYRRYTEEVNVYYDLPKLPHDVTPYVGVGAGAAEARSGWQLYDAARGANYATVPATHDTLPFVMLEGGVSVKLTRRLSLVPSYRYQRAIFRNQDDIFKVAGASPNTDIAHMFKVGLRYAF